MEKKYHGPPDATGRSWLLDQIIALQAVVPKDATLVSFLVLRFCTEALDCEATARQQGCQQNPSQAHQVILAPIQKGCAAEAAVDRTLLKRAFPRYGGVTALFAVHRFH